MKIIELFGAAGCGKTFMMNYIVKIYENSISQYDFPVYVIFNSRKAILTLKKFHNLYKLIRIVALSYILLCYSRRVSNNYEMLIKNYKQLLISSTISKEAIKARLKMLHRSLVYYDLALNNSNQEYLVMDEGFIQRLISLIYSGVDYLEIFSTFKSIPYSEMYLICDNDYSYIFNNNIKRGKTSSSSKIYQIKKTIEFTSLMEDLLVSRGFNCLKFSRSNFEMIMMNSSINL